MLKRRWARLLLVACLMVAACGSPKKKVTTEEIREGRDRELYAEGPARYAKTALRRGTTVAEYLDWELRQQSVVAAGQASDCRFILPRRWGIQPSAS